MTQINYRRIWPLIDLSAVCALQSTAGAASLVLNGTLRSPFVDGISFFNNGFIKTVSLTSSNDLSAATFTINGFQNGVPFSEEIFGPNNSNAPSPTTVYTLASFDLVTSITVNMAVNGVSAGSGNSGYLPLIEVNNAGNGLISWGLSVWIPNEEETGIVYQGYLTIDEIVNNGFTFDQMNNRDGNNLLYNVIFENNNTSEFLPIIGVNAKYILLQILDSTNLDTDTLYATFLQANG